MQYYFLVIVIVILNSLIKVDVNMNNKVDVKFFCFLIRKFSFFCSSSQSNIHVIVIIFARLFVFVAQVKTPHHSDQVTQG